MQHNLFMIELKEKLPLIAPNIVLLTVWHLEGLQKRAEILLQMILYEAFLLLEAKLQEVD